MQTVEGTLGRLAALADPVRRALYLYVAAAPHPVSRDQAARRLRIARPLAAFHLDKLVAQGLLGVTFRRLTRRRGPGAGRPSKLYHRSALRVDLSLPPQRYELAARLFAGVLAAAPAPPAALRRTARALGDGLGRAARPRAGNRPGRAGMLRHAAAALRALGYQPVREPDGAIRLRNCPFDALARDFAPLMCGTNLQLLAGVMRGLGLTGYTAALDPRPGMCCVVLRPSS